LHSRESEGNTARALPRRFSRSEEGTSVAHRPEEVWVAVLQIHVAQIDRVAESVCQDFWSRSLGSDRRSPAMTSTAARE
jgi:hypothetical protein